MGLLDLCEKYFKKTNLYEILGLSENATDKDVKKAYHKLSLKVHPDRVNENEKLEATEKFKVLSNIHAILSDKDKRAAYDETKTVDDEDNNLSERDWNVYWRVIFKKITVEDIEAYEKEYIGSQEERNDLKEAYLAGKGDMDYIVDHVQFARSEHEPRIKEIINDMIKKGEIPAYKIFTHEPDKKRKRRQAKENREANEAEEWKKEMGVDSGLNNLELMIRGRQESRAEKLIENLTAKYGSGAKMKASKRKNTKTDDVSKNKRKK